MNGGDALRASSQQIRDPKRALCATPSKSSYDERLALGINNVAHYHFTGATCHGFSVANCDMLTLHLPNSIIETTFPSGLKNQS